MSFLQSHIFVSVLVILLNPISGERHHHRHHHHNHHFHSIEQIETTQNPRENLDDPFVPPTYQPQSNETVEASNVSKMESRLETLEQYVRYLCLEDEEDVDRRIKHLGVKCICPQTEAPVCGSDNVTYYNRCFLQCHAKQALLNYHRHRITLRKFAPCSATDDDDEVEDEEDDDDDEDNY